MSLTSTSGWKHRVRTRSGQRQQVTRLPPYRPGDWVKLRDFDPRELGSDLSGKVCRVKSLTSSITTPDQRYAVWRVHFEDGRCVEWRQVERLATEAEIARAQQRAPRRERR